jgi:hypothetical protein
MSHVVTQALFNALRCPFSRMRRPPAGLLLIDVCPLIRLCLCVEQAAS